MKIKLVLLLVCIGAPATQAAVTYVGFETGVAPTFTAQRWSLTSEPKQFNTTPAQRYGTLGYYYLAPMPIGAEGAIFAAGTNNDITQQGTLFSKPAALSADPLIINGTWVNFPGYALTSNPAGDGVDRIGAMSAGMQVGGDYGFFNDFVFLPVLAGQSFRFGIMVDTLGEAQYGSSAVSIYDPTNLSVTYSSPLVADAFPELVFFDITNSSTSSATYSVALHRADPGTSGFSLLTFDPTPVPEPSSALLLGAGFLALLMARRFKAKPVS